MPPKTPWHLSKEHDVLTGSANLALAQASDASPDRATSLAGAGIRLHSPKSTSRIAFLSLMLKINAKLVYRSGLLYRSRALRAPFLSF
jgi:hypothetical protein